MYLTFDPFTSGQGNHRIATGTHTMLLDTTLLASPMHSHSRHLPKARYRHLGRCWQDLKSDCPGVLGKRARELLVTGI